MQQNEALAEVADNIQYIANSSKLLQRMSQDLADFVL
jgi:hypothetical protein